ncbi:hypothetical protein D3C79_991810 [compost metagenome]
MAWFPVLYGAYRGHIDDGIGQLLRSRPDGWCDFRPDLLENHVPDRIQGDCAAADAFIRQQLQ